MKTDRFWAALCVLMFMVFLLVSASKAETYRIVEKQGDKELKIGFSFDTFVLERWTRDRDVFVSTARKLGASVDIKNANGDISKQREHVRRFIEEDMDVIVIIAVDCFSLGDLVEQAKNKGIDVISYDRLIQNVATDLYITVDSASVGKEMARILIEYLPKGGDVVMICGPKMDSNSAEVVRGFETGIKGSNLKVVSKSCVESWAPEQGFKVATEVVQNVGHIDAIMCGNDGLAGYVVRALSERKMAGKVLVIGQDADVEACQRIVEGTQLMTVYKPIDQLAKTAAECAVKFAKVEKIVGTDIGRLDLIKTSDGWEVPYWGLKPIAVTKENMDEIVIDTGFHLREEVYMNVTGQEN